MLRGLVAALVVANLVLLAWSLGWLDGWPLAGRHSEREPERAARQVNPQAVQLIAPSAASAAMQAAAAAQRANLPPPGAAASEVATGASAEHPVCLEAGPFAAAEVAAAERGLRELPGAALSWLNVKSERGGTFIVYQGKFADNAALLRRRDELRRLQIDAVELRNAPELQPALSFGRFDNRADAEALLAQLQQSGVKSVRLVILTLPVVVTLLRVERADTELATRLGQLSLPPVGSRFKPCVNAPP